MSASLPVLPAFAAQATHNLRSAKQHDVASALHPSLRADEPPELELTQEVGEPLPLPVSLVPSLKLTATTSAHSPAAAMSTGLLAQQQRRMSTRGAVAAVEALQLSTVTTAAVGRPRRRRSLSLLPATHCFSPLCAS
jgi:hypothetical protein